MAKKIYVSLNKNKHCSLELAIVDLLVLGLIDASLLFVVDLLLVFFC